MRLLFAIFMLALPAFAAGDEDCNHRPMVVRSRPVIERLALKVVDPSDVLITEFEATIVAERKAGVVFSLSADGDTSILSKELSGLTRIADSPLTGLHALTTRKASSTIHRITDSGFTSEWAELNFSATGLAADGSGRIWTLEADTGRVVLIDAEGRPSTVVSLDEKLVDIAADDQGAYVLSASGVITSVTAGGSTMVVGQVSSSAQRIQIDARHQVIALVDEQNGRFALKRPSKGETNGKHVGTVPMGTSAFAYDSLGNLTLANPDLRAITRVTSHFELPCPHCGQPVKMTLDPNAPKPNAKAKRRSF